MPRYDLMIIGSGGAGMAAAICANELGATGKIIIATGTRPARPGMAGLDSVQVLDSARALELKTLPASMIVVGGGSVGLELAQVFGVLVIILEMAARVLPGDEPEIPSTSSTRS